MDKKLTKLGIFLSMFLCLSFFINLIPPAQAVQELTINTTENGTNATFSTFQGKDSLGENIWIGGGGLKSVGSRDYDFFGSKNSAFGFKALTGLTIGYNNSAFGNQALNAVTTGNYNVALGNLALGNLNDGNQNIAIGSLAGLVDQGDKENAIANDSIYLGFNTKPARNDEINQIIIGSNTIGSGSNSVTLGNDKILKTILKGNIGIGQSDPGYLLEVNGQSYFSQPVIVGTPVNDSDAVTLSYLNSAISAGSVWTTDRDHIYNANLGNVGIGTNAPAAKLEVNGGYENAELRISTPGGAMPMLSLFENSTSKLDLMYNTGIAYIRTGDNFGTGVSMYFQAKNLTRLAIDGETGNVGIGMTTPTEKLDVAGNIILKSTVGGTSALISTFQGVNSDGNNIFIGGGGQQSIGEKGQTDKGSNNTAYGINSLNVNTTGNSNTAVGGYSLYRNTTGISNTANGFQSLGANTTGNNNTANGFKSLFSNTTGSENTANGSQSLYSNTTGYLNTADGKNSLFSNTTGINNTAMGYASLFNNTVGGSNTAVGHSALLYNTTGFTNTAIGYNSLSQNVSGNSNVAVGYDSAIYTELGDFKTTGNYGVYLGNNAKASANGTNNEIVIGYDAIGNGSNSVTLGNTSITKTILRGNVGIGTTNPVGKLFVGSNWRTSHGGTDLYVGAGAGVTNTSNLGITYSVSNTSTVAPSVVGMTLYNDDTTIGGWSPLLLFSKAESGTTPYKATMAGIAAKAPLGTGNGDSWIDGELHFYTSGAATSGLVDRMVINKDGNVGLGTTTPSTAQLVIATSTTAYSFDSNGYLIKNVGTPILDTDAANKSYVDSALAVLSPNFIRRAVNDVNATATSTDNMISYTNVSVSRTVTIPATVCSAGKRLTIADESGSLSPTKSITIAPTGGTISGTSTQTIYEPYNNMSIYCSGTGNAWYIY